jgi:hypothetical protein
MPISVSETPNKQEHEQDMDDTFTRRLSVEVSWYEHKVKGLWEP